MKGISSKIVKTLVPGAVMTCADNSGAYELRMIHIIGKTGGRPGKMTAAGVGDLVSASVRKGSATYLKKPARVIVIRQKAPIRRSNGMRVRFEDNAAIMVTEDNLPIGTEVKGAMAREVVERFVKVAGVASRIV
ncbi:MAG: uL14 family ribosomal protein [Candidatus Micrarchaeota archaeon]|nr:uL14 family ribosomal protein [Candidatus Micrarchaeota archaeon]